MKLDVTKLPLGEALIGFVLGAVVLTFILAFAFAADGGIEGEEAVAELSPTPPPADVTPTPGGPSPELVQQGQKVAESFACTACHSTTGDVIVGPTWLNLFGTTVTLDDGTEVVVDETYIRESIQDPQAKVVQDFAPVMPTFPTLSDDDIDALTAFIQSLGEVGTAQEAAATPTPEASPEATPAP